MSISTVVWSSSANTAIRPSRYNNGWIKFGFVVRFLVAYDRQTVSHANSWKLRIFRDIMYSTYNINIWNVSKYNIRYCLIVSNERLAEIFKNKIFRWNIIRFEARIRPIDYHFLVVYDLVLDVSCHCTQLQQMNKSLETRLQLILTENRALSCLCDNTFRFKTSWNGPRHRQVAGKWWGKMLLDSSPIPARKPNQSFQFAHQISSSCSQKQFNWSWIFDSILFASIRKQNKNKMITRKLLTKYVLIELWNHSLDIRR